MYRTRPLMEVAQHQRASTCSRWCCAHDETAKDHDNCMSTIAAHGKCKNPLLLEITYGQRGCKDYNETDSLFLKLFSLPFQ